MTREIVARLPTELRSELREPLGPVFADAADLLAAAGSPLIAVGDVVTYHLTEAGRPPDVAVVDGLTEREAVDDEVWAGLPDLDRRVEVANEPATLSADLVRALADGIRGDERVLIEVDGEEDLAALPAVVAAPDGAAVVYGQPGEGMVCVTVTPEVRAEMRDLLERMEPTEELWTLLDTGGTA